MGRRKRSEKFSLLLPHEVPQTPVVKQNSKVATLGFTHATRYPDRRRRMRGNPPDDWNKPLPPTWIVGFSEGEAAFGINIQPSTGKKVLFTISPFFNIALSDRDEAVLHRIKATLGVGLVHKHGRKGKYVIFFVTGIRECLVLKDFFLNNPLYAQKQATFKVWCDALNLIVSRQAETEQGFLRLCKLRDKMNPVTKRTVSYKDFYYFKHRLEGQFPLL